MTSTSTRTGNLSALTILTAILVDQHPIGKKPIPTMVPSPTPLPGTCSRMQIRKVNG